MNFKIIKKQPHQCKGYFTYTLDVLNKETGLPIQLISSKSGDCLTDNIKTLLDILN